ncbi:hypothetical protein N2W52_001962 [Clostridium perfringens]|nr:hypothetical protein [Clostridium perfringens]MDK0982979.1 hypothetical protein [Clostridium perfringens]
MNNNFNNAIKEKEKYYEEIKNNNPEEFRILEDTLGYQVFNLSKNINSLLEEIITTIVEMNKGIFVLTLFMIVAVILVHYT